MKRRNYLEEAALGQYHNYTKKGLKLRVQPFLMSNLPDKKKNLLVVGVALGGHEEIMALNKFFPKYKVYGIDVAKISLKQELNAKLV